MKKMRQPTNEGKKIHASEELGYTTRAQVKCIASIFNIKGFVCAFVRRKLLGQPQSMLRPVLNVCIKQCVPF